jgi:hypothetical protein
MSSLPAAADLSGPKANFFQRIPNREDQSQEKNSNGYDDIEDDVYGTKKAQGVKNKSSGQPATGVENAPAAHLAHGQQAGQNVEGAEEQDRIGRDPLLFYQVTHASH